jgi:hypothetical protein
MLKRSIPALTDKKQISFPPISEVCDEIFVWESWNGSKIITSDFILPQEYFWIFKIFLIKC